MSAGIVLIIVGAVFAFALRSDGTWVDTRALGAILMLGGLAFVVRGLVGRREVLVHEEETEQAGSPGGLDEPGAERHVVVEKRVE
ncbi:MAG TPA: hypothetical protein VN088_11625 [Nocardioides sp.]|nr:hypothetical protein [Nocardioides sp.]